MQKFKVGDRIRETYSGDRDTGVITKPNPDSSGGWYVLWDADAGFPGEELWLYESDMEVIEKPTLDGETIVISGVEYRLTKI